MYPNKGGFEAQIIFIKSVISWLSVEIQFVKRHRLVSIDLEYLIIAFDTYKPY